MKPTLHDGEFVLINPNKVPQPGDLAVFDHPKIGGLAVVKRVLAIEDSGAFTVRCDNPNEGSDSRTWGPLPSDSVHGVVTVVLDRPADSLLLDDEACSTD